MPKAKNTEPSPMTYERLRIPNLRARRAALARDAETLTREELEREAQAAGIDTAGAKTKAEAVEAVRSSAPR